MNVAAVDLGGTKLAVAIVATDGAILRRDAVPLAGRQGAEVGALIAERMAALDPGAEVAGIGVAVPGIYDAARGTVWAPNIPGWDEYPLLDELRAVTRGRVPVEIDSDRACYVLGEAWRGAARGCRDVIFLAVGTGIGAGVLVDGRVLRGRAGIAGAVGWLALDRPYRPEYVGCGCFEHHASGPGLAKVARELLLASPDYRGPLREREPDAITAPDIFAARDTGDALAARVLDEAIAFWGMAVANLVSIFDPEAVVFGGGVFGPAGRLLDRIRDEALRWAQPVAMPGVRLLVSALGGDAGLYGAARLALGPQQS